MTEEELDHTSRVIEDAKQRHLQKREQRAARATQSMKGDDIKAAWVYGIKAQEDYTGIAVKPNNKDIGIFKKHWTRYARGQNMKDFFILVCTRWDDFRLGPMSWFRDFPREPSFSFVAYNIRFLLEAAKKLDTKVQAEEGSFSQRVKRRRWRDVKGED